MSLQLLKVLRRFQGKTTHDITLDDLKAVSATLNLSFNEEMASTLLEQLKTDSIESVTDWVLEPDNQQKLLDGIKPATKPKLTIECDQCNELNMVDVAEVPTLKPHIVCRHCGVYVSLEEDGRYAS